MFFFLFGSKITADGDCSHEIKRRLLLERKVMTKLESIFKSRDITLPTKVHLIDDFSSSHVWMWELEYKESWAPKNWCFWTVATWCKELTHLKRPWCWERLKAGGEGDNRAYGWMASSTPWTWVWVNSRSWWWTGRPGVLQSMGLQSWTWLSNWTELKWLKVIFWYLKVLLQKYIYTLKLFNRDSTCSIQKIHEE